jgi:hypothetical protein
MQEGWVLIFRANETYQAKIAEDVLKQNGIESHILSTPDSVIPSLGEAKLYTPSENAVAARKILAENELIQEEE